MGQKYLLIALGVVALELGSGASAMLMAQRGQPPRSQAKADSIPKQYRPPAGMCRIWIDGVPPTQQPAPTDCATAVKNKPNNGRVIYGEEKKPSSRDSNDKGLPIKSFKPLPTRKPPPPGGDSAWESRKISDADLFGDRPAGFPPASSFPGVTGSAGQVMGSYYDGYVNSGGVIVGTGPVTDPRYLSQNRNVRPPGYGSSICLDRDGDGGGLEELFFSLTGGELAGVAA